MVVSRIVKQDYGSKIEVTFQVILAKEGLGIPTLGNYDKFRSISSDFDENPPGFQLWLERHSVSMKSREGQIISGQYFISQSVAD